MSWQIYICECADKTLYTGVAKDLALRIAKHNSGQGAKYTRSRLPVKLLYSESAGTRGQALSREYAIRKLPAEAKRELANRGDLLP